MWQIQAVQAALGKAGKIAITTHRSPDGDALGSALGLQHYLIKKGFEVDVVSPTDYGDFLKWLPGNDAVINYEEQQQCGYRKLQEADLVFCLDFNQTSRVEGLEPALNESTSPKVLIDHHPEAQGFEDYSLWDPTAAATAELVYQFINDCGDADLMDADIGTCLYTGILTDSGSFRFSSTSPHLHQMAAHILQSGVDHVKIHEHIYDTFTENSLRFFGHCFSNCLHLFREYRTAIIEVTQADMNAFGVTKHQTEGLVNFALSIQGVIFAAIVKEGDGFSKISFRSKGDFPANAFATEFFEGGGHANAAGGKCHANTAKTIQLFRERLDAYKALLKQS